MTYSAVNYKHYYYLDCGTIVSKSQDEVVIKYGTETELYLNVQFKKAGFRSVKVNPTTYFKFNVGENICFDLKAEPPNEYHDFLMKVGFIFLILIGFAIGVLIVAILI